MSPGFSASGRPAQPTPPAAKSRPITSVGAAIRTPIVHPLERKGSPIPSRVCQTGTKASSGGSNHDTLNRGRLARQGIDVDQDAAKTNVVRGHVKRRRHISDGCAQDRAHLAPKYAAVGAGHA